MEENTKLERPDLSTPKARINLSYRPKPYWSLLAYGRHIGYHKLRSNPYWVARLRTVGQSYVQQRLGVCDDVDIADGDLVLSYEQATKAARRWFREANQRRVAADERPIGVTEHLIVCPVGDLFTVGHALHDYVEWKRVAAAKSHFQAVVALANFHIVPRLASLPIDDFNGEILRRFVHDVLETPPRRGNQPLGPRRAIEGLDEEAIRKRKKTINTLIGILCMAFQIAWENGKFESERAWRCLRRLPSVDRPRILHLSRTESKLLLDACRPDLRRLVLGARILRSSVARQPV